MKQLTWLRIVHSRDWCLHLALRTRSSACHRRRRPGNKSDLFYCPHKASQAPSSNKHHWDNGKCRRACYRWRQVHQWRWSPGSSPWQERTRLGRALHHRQWTSVPAADQPTWGMWTWSVPHRLSLAGSYLCQVGHTAAHLQSHAPTPDHSVAIF